MSRIIRNSSDARACYLLELLSPDWTGHIGWRMLEATCASTRPFPRLLAVALRTI
jgi:hypothetical protein